MNWGGGNLYLNWGGGESASKPISSGQTPGPIMGIFIDLRFYGKAFDVTHPHTALNRHIHHEFDWFIIRGDVDYFDEVLPRDEVQVISQLVALPDGAPGNAGKYLLNFTLSSGVTFNSRPIPLKGNTNVIANAIWRGGIDANITDWNSMTVQVSAGTNLTESDIELTFSGELVAMKHPGQTTVTLDSKAMERFTLSDTPWSTLKTGQPVRPGWAALVAMGVARATDIPPLGETPQHFVPVTNAGDNARYPARETLEALALEVAIEDNNANTETVILASTGLLSQ